MEGHMSLQSLIDAAGIRLADAFAAHHAPVFTTSLGLEDMVVLDLIHKSGLPVEVVTLDTGRLYEETYALLDRARERYARPIRIYWPQADALEAFVAQEGVNPFYRSIDLRKRCCEIRKTEPLKRALAGKDLWITGLRRTQSVTRTTLQAFDRDELHGIDKCNPLVDWSSQEVSAYCEQFKVPVNELHQRGFPSIGCAPCTRAVTAGEDERAGRWWWESAQTRECGLHMAPDGKLVRAKTMTETQ
jgi:phosphoadenosine phosphosulfate reductase